MVIFSLSRAVRRLFLFVAFWGMIQEGYGQWMTQEVSLIRGENSVFLYVTPENDCDVMLPTGTVSEVRFFNPYISEQFEASPSDFKGRMDEWLYWRAAAGGGIPNTLAKLQGGEGYIMVSPAGGTLVVTGRVEQLDNEWMANDFSIAGFEVSKDRTMVIQKYLAPVRDDIEAVFSPFEVSGGQITWTEMSWDTQNTFGRGDAYFIKTKGSMGFDGVFSAEGGAVFNTPEEVSVLVLQNRGDEERTFEVTLLDSLPDPGGKETKQIPLQYWSAQTMSYQPVARGAAAFSLKVAAGEDAQVVFALDSDNGELQQAGIDTNLVFAGILKVTDDTGTLEAYRPARYEPSRVLAGRSAWPYGLWVGEVTLSGVDFVEYKGGHSESVLQDTTGVFTHRLLVHNGTNGQVRLLSHVVCVLETNNAGGSYYGLYTDDRMVPADADRDGLFRISSPVFGMMPPLLLSGTFLDGTCSGDYVLRADDPMNPFYHAYNPNLNRMGTNTFAITNHYELTWTEGTNAPLVGTSGLRKNGACAGIYKHRVTGLRHDEVNAQGTFVLEWISGTGALK